MEKNRTLCEHGVIGLPLQLGAGASTGPMLSNGLIRRLAGASATELAHYAVPSFFPVHVQSLPVLGRQKKLVQNTAMTTSDTTRQGGCPMPHGAAAVLTWPASLPKCAKTELGPRD